MPLASLEGFMRKLDVTEPVTPEEQTTIANETTTRKDPDVPEVGAPATPEPQDPTGVSEPGDPEPAPVTTEEVVTPVVVESEVEVPAPGTVELPPAVTPEQIEEIQTTITEVVTTVKEEGVTPTSMKFLNTMLGSTMKQFGLVLPKADSLKKGSINLQASVDTVNALCTLSKYIRAFKTTK